MKDMKGKNPRTGTLESFAEYLHRAIGWNVLKSDKKWRIASCECLKVSSFAKKYGVSVELIEELEKDENCHITPMGQVVSFTTTGLGKRIAHFTIEGYTWQR